MKFCKDCKWFSPTLGERILSACEVSKCAHPSALEEESERDNNYLVTGKIEYIRMSAARNRMDIHKRCGRNATYWEPKS